MKYHVLLKKKIVTDTVFYAWKHNVNILFIQAAGSRFTKDYNSFSDFFFVLGFSD